MLKSRALEKGQRGRRGAREALLAATAMQLLPGDLLCSTVEDTTVAELAPAALPGRSEKKPGKKKGYVAPRLSTRLTACAAMARGLQAAGTEGIVLAFASAGEAEPGWAEALAWAQAEQLQLLLACNDATGGAAMRRGRKSAETKLTWTAMNRLAARLYLPILAVDGEDAVAVYRVMQESVIRARSGGGPAVIWAVTTPPSETLSRSRTPIARLESYLAVRKIKLSKKS